jgi:hypothetical protein
MEEILLNNSLLVFFREGNPFTVRSSKSSFLIKKSKEYKDLLLESRRTSKERSGMAYKFPLT